MAATCVCRRVQRCQWRPTRRVLPVTFSPGEKFSSGQGIRSTFLLCFASSSIAQVAVQVVVQVAVRVAVRLSRPPRQTRKFERVELPERSRLSARTNKANFGTNSATCCLFRLGSSCPWPSQQQRTALKSNRRTNRTMIGLI